MESLLHRKERLILTAIEIINDSGLQGLSTSEIAKREGLTTGAMFKHFKTKKELMLEILNYYSQYDRDIFESIKIKDLSPEKAIWYFAKAYVEYYENYPAITAIIQSYDELARDSQLVEKIKYIFDIRNEFLMKLIDKAIMAGDLVSDIDSKALANIIIGSFRNLCLKWRLHNFSFSLKEEMLKTLEMILKAFSPKDTGKSGIFNG